MKVAQKKKSREVVLITGVGGALGRRLEAALADDYTVAGVDLKCGDSPHCHEIDLTKPSSIEGAFDRIESEYGNRIASVVHLAAYFDFSGEESPLYDAVNVKGTRNLLDALQRFEVGQFVYTSTMLVHAPTVPGVPINEDSPLDAKWAYPQSKLATEKVIDENRGEIPTVVLRLAGAYSELCGLPTLSHQFQRIYERRLQSHLFSGDTSRGQSFAYIEDIIDAIRRTIERRDRIEAGTRILIGEPRVLSYEALQNRIGELLHGEQWRTLRIPKPVARVGAWAQEKSEPIVPDSIDEGEKPFIRSFMIPMADDHYELDISRARKLLGWEPGHNLYDMLPKLAESLKSDPDRWYAANKLRTPPLLDALEDEDVNPERIRKAHEKEQRASHQAFLWAHFLTIGLGAWLLCSPPILGYESGPMWISDLVSGGLIVVLACFSLSWRNSWARAANGLVGIWVMFAPLVFWAPTAAAYANGTLVGALVAGLAMLARPPVGVGPVASQCGPAIPPGWDYSPSEWTQRLPIIALAFVGLYISRYLAAFQLGHTNAAWDPFFGAGTERIITSDVSKAWPVPDAGLGALTYMLEILTGLVGDRRRWRTMPWLVILFGIMIVPLGAVSIFFIVIQPIAIGTWCTLCLVAAMAMLLQIPYSLDELLATLQMLVQRHRQGHSALVAFFRGDTMTGGRDDGRDNGRHDGENDFERPVSRITRDILGGGVNLPWNLVVSALVGVWLMSTRLVFGTEPPMADGDHLIGALVVTISITAFAEIARPVRFLNALLGACLLATPFLFDGGTAAADAGSALAGLLLIALSLPRGRVRGHYGSWDRFIV